MIPRKNQRKKKANIFGVFKGEFIELVPDPFNTGYEEMKAQKEREARLKKRVKL